jgi:hypothetical protein
MRMILSGIALIALSGCGTTGTSSLATPEPGANVQVVGSAEAIKGCQFITQVRGDQNLYGGVLFHKAAMDDAVRQMKAKTAQAGGNRLYLVDSQVGAHGANTLGDAYLCKA